MPPGSVKIISFDLDGTLVYRDHVDYFWLELIPLLYAQRHGVDLDHARAIVLSEYDRIGEDDIRWYLPEYWLRRFDLKVSVKDALRSVRPLIRFKPGVFEVLPEVSKDYKLIIVSNASIEFIQLVLENMGELRHIFSRVYSCVSNFCIPRKNEIFFKLICQNMGIAPPEVLHLGDNPLYDLEIPRKVGIRAYLLSEGKQTQGEFVLCNLHELPDILSRLSST